MFSKGRTNFVAQQHNQATWNPDFGLQNPGVFSPPIFFSQEQYSSLVVLPSIIEGRVSQKKSELDHTNEG